MLKIHFVNGETIIMKGLTLKKFNDIIEEFDIVNGDKVLFFTDKIAFVEEVEE